MLIDMDEKYIHSDIDIKIEVIKTIFLMLFIYYTNFKITNKKLEVNLKLVKDICIIAVFATLWKIIKSDVNVFITAISYILVISIIFSKDKIIKSIIATSISISINYTILTLSVVINFGINYLTKLNNDYINLIIILVGHLFLIYNFCNIKKFKTGFAFLKDGKQNEYIDILVLNISVILLFLIIILANSNIVLARDSILSTITAVLIMFITIQKSLQLYYKQKIIKKRIR